jgi:hypothetical protein
MPITAGQQQPPPPLSLCHHHLSLCVPMAASTPCTASLTQSTRSTLQYRRRMSQASANREMTAKMTPSAWEVKLGKSSRTSSRGEVLMGAVVLTPGQTVRSSPLPPAPAGLGCSQTLHVACCHCRCAAYLDSWFMCSPPYPCHLVITLVMTSTLSGASPCQKMYFCRRTHPGCRSHNTPIHIPMCRLHKAGALKVCREVDPPSWAPHWALPLLGRSYST